MNRTEFGPQMPSPEVPASGVERLRNIRLRLEETRKDLDTRIDELMKHLGKIITAAEENSIGAGQQDDVLKEVLESQEIFRQVHELREASDRLRSLIDQLSKVDK